jgi:hypothetical protein
VEPSEFTRLVRAAEARLDGPALGAAAPGEVAPGAAAPADPGSGLSRPELIALLASWLLARGTRKERKYGQS